MRTISAPATPVLSLADGGDAAYSGQRDVIRQHAPKAKSFIQAEAHRHWPLSETERARNRTKSKVRAKVEHAFLVRKRIFGWGKVRYRGLAKNTHWLYISCGLANLYVARRRLMAGVYGTLGQRPATSHQTVVPP
ncbi:MAG: transposase [Nitrospira sp.]